MSLETLIRESAARQVAAAPERTVRWSDLEARVRRAERLRPIRFAAGAGLAAAAAIALVVAFPQLRFGDGGGQVIPAYAPVVPQETIWSMEFPRFRPSNVPAENKVEEIRFAAGDVAGTPWHLIVNKTTDYKNPSTNVCRPIEVRRVGTAEMFGDNALFCPASMKLAAAHGRVARLDASFTFGGVSTTATRVEVRLDNGDRYVTETIPGAPSIDFNLFVIVLPKDAKPVKATAFDAAGVAIAAYDYENLEEVEGTGMPAIVTS